MHFFNKAILFCSILVSLFLSCSKNSEQTEPTVISFNVSSCQVAYKETIPIPITVKGCAISNITLKSENDFIAKGTLIEGAVMVTGSHVGKTQITLSYNNVEAKCDVEVTSEKSSGVFGRPLIAFDQSKSYILSNAEGDKYDFGDPKFLQTMTREETEMYTSPFKETNISCYYNFTDDKLKCIGVYFELPIQNGDKTQVYSLISDALDERYSFVGNSEWKMPNQYVVRLQTRQRQIYSYEVWVWYAPNDEILNQYTNTGRTLK